MNELFKDNKISYNLSKKIPSLKQHASEAKGKLLGSIWNDLPVAVKPDEKTGYVSQQPLELLKRVIHILSNSGDMILDPFCGSGTSLIAAELEDRSWIGSDISTQAIDLTLSRLKTTSQITKSKIVFGDKKSVLKRFEEIYQLPDVKVISAIVSPLKLNLTKKQADTNLDYEQPKPLIITEGKTDWCHY
jgi:site-specific DNA-methyltransferase (adenine-specific)